MTISIPKYFTRKQIKVSGIYFLLYRGKIVYVGKSIDVLSRIVAGDVPRLEKVDKIRIILCAPDKLNYYEKRWIIRFRPKHNRAYLYMHARTSKGWIRYPINTDGFKKKDIKIVSLPKE